MSKTYVIFCLNPLHKTCLIKVDAGHIPRVNAMLKCTRAPQPMSSNITTIIVEVAGDLAPEGVVPAESRILGCEEFVCFSFIELV